MRKEKTESEQVHAWVVFIGAVFLAYGKMLPQLERHANSQHAGRSAQRNFSIWALWSAAKSWPARRWNPFGRQDWTSGAPLDFLTVLITHTHIKSHGDTHTPRQRLPGAPLGRRSGYSFAWIVAVTSQTLSLGGNAEPIRGLRHRPASCVQSQTKHRFRAGRWLWASRTL